MTAKTNTWFDQQVQKFESSRFGAMTIMMTAQSCLGSIAAMVSLKSDNYVFLAFITAFTLASNGAFISLAPAKWCVGIFFSSVFVSVLSIITLLLIG